MFFYGFFRFTHFPIRFNCKNRMVYVFRRNGTVLTVPWATAFFCLREPISEGNDYVIEGVTGNHGIRGEGGTDPGLSLSRSASPAAGSGRSRRR